MRKKGELVDLILNALETCGPMTRVEICEELGLTHRIISAVVSRLAKKQKRKPKRIYIKDYTFEAYNSPYRYPKAVYDIGNKPDAKKKKRDRRKEYYESKKKKVNSVWALGEKSTVA